MCCQMNRYLRKDTIQEIIINPLDLAELSQPKFNINLPHQVTMHYLTCSYRLRPGIIHQVVRLMLPNATAMICGGLRTCTMDVMHA